MKSRKREGTTDSASKTRVLEPVSQIVSRSNPGQLISEVLRSNANKPERISCFEEETNILVSIDLDSMHASDTSRAGTNECFQLTSRNKRVLSTISNTRASFYQPGFRYQFQSGTAQGSSAPEEPIREPFLPARIRLSCPLHSRNGICLVETKAICSSQASGQSAKNTGRELSSPALKLD